MKLHECRADPGTALALQRRAHAVDQSARRIGPVVHVSEWVPLTVCDSSQRADRCWVLANWLALERRALLPDVQRAQTVVRHGVRQNPPRARISPRAEAKWTRTSLDASRVDVVEARRISRGRRADEPAAGARAPATRTRRAR